MGALSQNLFTVIVIMAALTTLAMPPTLRWAFAWLPLDQSERHREAAQVPIVREAHAGGFDLVVLGVSPRPGDQLFCGEVAADLPANAPCSIDFLSCEPITTAPPVTHRTRRQEQS
jgi:hypothetical protein